MAQQWDARKEDKGRAEVSGLPLSDRTRGVTVLVLIVDDESPIARVVADLIADIGYTPVTAANGQEALLRARERWPSLVVTDLMMPELDGAGLIDALRTEAASGGHAMPAIILMTAAGLNRARAAGADAVLPKPFNLDELEELLHRFLD